MIKKIAMTLVCAAACVAVQAQTVENSPKKGRAARFDRGLGFDTKTPAIPKGLWIAGLNVSYSQHSNEDYKILLVNDLSSKGNTLNISPMVHYVFANNQSIGLRFQYKRFSLDLANISLDLGDLTDGSLFGPYSLQSHTYIGYLSYRYYVGLGAGKRFLFFNEVQAGLGGGQQKELSGEGDAPGSFETGTFQKTFNLKLGMAPGMTAFITNQVALEVTIGLLGFEYKKITQTTDRTIERSRTTSSISTKLDLLSIGFGMTFYL